MGQLKVGILIIVVKYSHSINLANQIPFQLCAWHSVFWKFSTGFLETGVPRPYSISLCLVILMHHNIYSKEAITWGPYLWFPAWSCPTQVTFSQLGQISFAKGSSLFAVFSCFNLLKGCGSFLNLFFSYQFRTSFQWLDCSGYYLCLHVLGQLGTLAACGCKGNWTLWSWILRPQRPPPGIKLLRPSDLDPQVAAPGSESGLCRLPNPLHSFWLSLINRVCSLDLQKSSPTQDSP